MRPPSIELLQGMSEEERVEFSRSWQNATWLTDPLTRVLRKEANKLINQLIDSNEDADTIRAQIKAYHKLLELLP